MGFRPRSSIPRGQRLGGCPTLDTRRFRVCPILQAGKVGPFGRVARFDEASGDCMRAGETGGCPTFRGLKRGAFGPQFNSPRSTTGRVPHLGDKTVSRVPHPSGLESWATDARVPHVSRFETWGFRPRSSIPRGQRLGGRPILTTKRCGRGPKFNSPSQCTKSTARSAIPLSEKEA